MVLHGVARGACALGFDALEAQPERIISWFVRRWQMESTFQEVPQRLGFETQRHWSELAVRRTAPALLGLFSMVTLLAHRYIANKGASVIRGAAWYEKQRPTFSDALALVRRSYGHGKLLFAGRTRKPTR